MKRFTINTSITIVSKLGITLALLWVLGGGSAPSIAAPVPSVTESHVNAPTAPAAELRVCFGGCLYSSIQDAVDAANDGDVIKVAAGTYIDMNNYGGLAQVVYIDKSVTIRGGYTTAFTDPPDPEANPTTLDAQGQGRVLYITGNINPTIEGLRITGGDAAGLGNGWWWGGDVGGGVYVVNATAIIRDNQVFGNTADYGGGLCLDESAATLSDNAIFSNTASGTNWRNGGGGLFLGWSDATLSGNTISNNTANWNGGGLFLVSSAATLDENTISSNIANKNGGGLYLEESAATLGNNTISANTANGDWLGDGGGGLYLEKSDATLSNNTISANTAPWGGGGGGGLFLEGSAAILDSNTISSNTVNKNGGGLYLEESDATLSNNTISANTANGIDVGDGGGGLYLSWSNATLNGNTVTSNTAIVSGGGLYMYHSDNATLSGNTVSSNAADTGGGLYLSVSNATLDGNTVTANTAVNTGGGLYLGDGTAMLTGNTVTANIVNGTGWWNGGGGLYLDRNNATLVNNVVADNQADNVGSGLYIRESTPRMLHTTIAHNTGGDGNGIYVHSSTVILINTILVGHTMGVYVESGDTARLEGTLWGSGAWANDTDWGGDGTVIIGTVNVWGDPAFVDPDADDYHIGPGSAAINAGLGAEATDDMDGDPRDDGYPDIGADEIIANPDLSITKRATPDPVQPGDQLTYTISVANTGNMNLHATITDTLPFSVTLGETSGGTLALPGGAVGITWTAFIAAPDGVWMETVVVTVDDGQEGPLTNRVDVTTKEGATGKAIAIVNAHKVYLPLVLRNP